MKRIPIVLCLLALIHTNNALSMLNSFNAIKSRLAPSFTMRSGNKRLIHIDKIKGLYNDLTPEAKKFSPVHGVALFEGYFLKNIYKFGAKNSALTQLINNDKIGIFHMLDDQLRATQNKSNPAYALTPELTAALIGSLHNGSIHEQSTKQSITTQLRKSYQEKTNSTLSKSKANQFINAFIAAGTECATHPTSSSQSYIAVLPYVTLLAQLHSKTNDKQDMIAYLKSLEHFMPVLQSNPSYQALINDNYTEGQSFLSLFENYYESSVHGMIKKDEEYCYPPAVRQSAYGFNGKNPAPDCMETAMHNICNWLMSDGTGPYFNSSILPKHINMHESLKKFYTDFKSFKSVNEAQRGQAWMNLVSDISTVKYRREKYELKATSNNIIPLFNYLFTIQAQSLDDLGTLLSDERRTVTFKKLNDDETCIAVCFVDAKTKKATTLKLTFLPNHARIEVPNNKETLRKPIDLLLNSIEAEKYTNGAFLAPLLNKSVGGDYVDNLMSRNGYDINEDYSPLHYIYWLFSQDLGNPSDRFHSIIRLRDLNNWHAHENLVNIVINLIESLPENDFYFHSSLSKALCFFPDTAQKLLTMPYFQGYFKKYPQGIEKLLVKQLKLYKQNSTLTPNFEFALQLLEYLPSKANGYLDILLQKDSYTDSFALPLIMHAVKSINTLDENQDNTQFILYNACCVMHQQSLELFITALKNRNVVKQSYFDYTLNYILMFRKWSYKQIISNHGEIITDYNPLLKNNISVLLKHGAQMRFDQLIDMLDIRRDYIENEPTHVQKDYDDVLQIVEKNVSLNWLQKLAVSFKKMRIPK